MLPFDTPIIPKFLTQKKTVPQRQLQNLFHHFRILYHKGGLVQTETGGFCEARRWRGCGQCCRLMLLRNTPSARCYTSLDDTKRVCPRAIHCASDIQIVIISVIIFYLSEPHNTPLGNKRQLEIVVFSLTFHAKHDILYAVYVSHI